MTIGKTVGMALIGNWREEKQIEAEEAAAAEAEAAEAEQAEAGEAANRGAPDRYHIRWLLLGFRSSPFRRNAVPFSD